VTELRPRDADDTPIAIGDIVQDHEDESLYYIIRAIWIDKSNNTNVTVAPMTIAHEGQRRHSKTLRLI